MTLDSQRRDVAHGLAVYLAGLGAVAIVGSVATEIAGAPTFALGTLFGAHVVLTGVALIAATLEWKRERLAESAAVAATAGGVVLTFVDLANGFWYFAPFLGIMTLLATFALVNRFLTRDEHKHRPKMWTG